MVGGCHDSESGVPISRTWKAVWCKQDAFDSFGKICRVSCALVIIQYEVYSLHNAVGRSKEQMVDAEVGRDD
jgi:hypothetical protein